LRVARSELCSPTGQRSAQRSIVICDKLTTQPDEQEVDTNLLLV
jgi:hypothetical protein